VYAIEDETGLAGIKISFAEREFVWKNYF